MYIAIPSAIYTLHIGLCLIFMKLLPRPFSTLEAILGLIDNRYFWGVLYVAASILSIIGLQKKFIRYRLLLILPQMFVLLFESMNMLISAASFSNPRYVLGSAGIWYAFSHIYYVATGAK